MIPNWVIVAVNFNTYLKIKVNKIPQTLKGRLIVGRLYLKMSSPMKTSKK